MDKTEKRLKSLEKRADMAEKMMKKIEGILMNNDFDFDSLLDDIETEETPTPQTAPQTAQDAPESIVAPVEDIPLDIDSPEMPAPEPDVVDELDALLDEEATEPVKGLSALAQDPEVQKRAKESGVDLENIKDNEISWTTTGVEYAQENLDAAKVFQQWKLEDEATKEERKAIKKELADSGVDIPMVKRAQREVDQELKETAEESQAIEDLKKIFRNDGNYMTTATALVK